MIQGELPGTNRGGGNLVCVLTVYGQLRAMVAKSRLEFNGIPVVLRYESAGNVFGITVDGLGKIDVLVPQAAVDDATTILESAPEQVHGDNSGPDETEGQ